MMIWDIRGEGQAPQHIGNYDGLGSLNDLVKAGNAARHHMTRAVIAKRGNDVKCYTFSNDADYSRFFGNNPDLMIADDTGSTPHA